MNSNDSHDNKPENSDEKPSENPTGKPVEKSMESHHPNEPAMVSPTAPGLPPIAGEWQSRLHPKETVVIPSAAGSGAPPTLLVNPGPQLESLQFETRQLRVTDFLFALLLTLISVFAVFKTYAPFGHSWDEALYLYPSENVGSWVTTFLDGKDKTIFESNTINRYWGSDLDSNDPLHPEIAPVPKLLTAFGLTRLTEWFGFDPMTASRLPFAALFGATVALIYLLGAREYGRYGGFAAAIMYLLMPRIFAHAHFAASETAIAFFIVLTVACFLLANRWWVVALFTGLALGLAIATKFTAFLLPVPLMIWGQIYRRRDYASNVFAMAFFAPLVMLALWPWLWHDTLRRLFSYFLFYTEHQKTALYYLGRPWGYIHGPVAPWYYPFHIIFVSLPVWMLVLAALGVLRAAVSSVRRPLTILFLMLAVFWPAVSALPNAPRYDGERLFFPAFAFIALLGGAGFSGIFETLQSIRVKRGADSFGGVKVIAGLLILVMAAVGTTELWLSRANLLNYFNQIVGGTAGANRKGFETTYWGESLNDETIAQLNKILKPGDKVKPLAMNGLALENLRKWKKLPDGVDFSPLAPPYDYFIMQYRQGFMGRTERMLQRTQKPLYVYEADGVPLIGIFSGIGVEGNTTPTLTVVTDQKSTETTSLPVNPDGITPPLHNTTSGTVEGTTVPKTMMELPPPISSLSTDTVRTRYITTGTLNTAETSVSKEERLSTQTITDTLNSVPETPQ